MGSSQIESLLGRRQVLIKCYKVGRQVGLLHLLQRVDKLHLHLVDLPRVSIFFLLEIEVVDVLRVERLNPLGDNQRLVKQLHSLILLGVLCLVILGWVEIKFELHGQEQHDLVDHLVE